MAKEHTFFEHGKYVENLRIISWMVMAHIIMQTEIYTDENNNIYS